MAKHIHSMVEDAKTILIIAENSTITGEVELIKLVGLQSDETPGSYNLLPRIFF